MAKPSVTPHKPTEVCTCEDTPEHRANQADYEAKVHALARHLHRSMTRYCREHDAITFNVCLGASESLTHTINWQMHHLADDEDVPAL